MFSPIYYDLWYNIKIKLKCLSCPIISLCKYFSNLLISLYIAFKYIAYVLTCTVHQVQRIYCILSECRTALPLQVLIDLGTWTRLWNQIIKWVRDEGERKHKTKSKNWKLNITIKIEVKIKIIVNKNKNGNKIETNDTKISQHINENENKN